MKQHHCIAVITDKEKNDIASFEAAMKGDLRTPGNDLCISFMHHVGGETLQKLDSLIKKKKPRVVLLTDMTRERFIRLADRIKKKFPGTKIVTDCTFSPPADSAITVPKITFENISPFMREENAAAA